MERIVSVHDLFWSAYCRMRASGYAPGFDSGFDLGFDFECDFGGLGIC
jgi:hypothetical protein